MDNSNYSLEDRLDLRTINKIAYRCKSLKAGIGVRVNQLRDFLEETYSCVLSENEIDDIVRYITIEMSVSIINDICFFRFSYDDILKLTELYLPRLANCIRNSGTSNGTLYAFYSSFDQSYSHYQPRHKCVEPGMCNYSGTINFSDCPCRDMSKASKNTYFIIFNNNPNVNSDIISTVAYLNITKEYKDIMKDKIVEDYNKVLSKYGVRCDWKGEKIFYSDL